MVMGYLFLKGGEKPFFLQKATVTELILVHVILHKSCVWHFATPEPRQKFTFTYFLEVSEK